MTEGDKTNTAFDQECREGGLILVFKVEGRETHIFWGREAEANETNILFWCWEGRLRGWKPNFA